MKKLAYTELNKIPKIYTNTTFDTAVCIATYHLSKHMLKTIP